MKTSRRRRPREEWLPVQLPPSLVLVSRERWQRVQDRLQRNRCFCPGNARHFYLLQGLVRCGSCGARYTGDPSHGKFSYRCYTRCHQQPSIRESALDEAVVSVIEALIQNPELVLDQMERLSRIDPEAEAARKVQAGEIETELRRLDSEETRLLEAYRSEIITAGQLGVELERLKARRQLAEDHRSELLAVRPPVDTKAVKRSVQDYCREVKRRYRALPPEQLREFLRTVITEITFEGSRIRIQGHLPTYRPPEKPEETDLDLPPDPTAIPPGSGRGIDFNSDAWPVPSPEAQEVTTSGVAWTVATPVACDPHRRPRTAKDPGASPIYLRKSRVGSIRHFAQAREDPVQNHPAVPHHNDVMTTEKRGKVCIAVPVEIPVGDRGRNTALLRPKMKSTPETPGAQSCALL